MISGPSPQETFPRFRNWAESYGFRVSGEQTKGNLEGTPVGLAGLVVGRIRGSYLVNGNTITILLEEDLPPNEVATRLTPFGLTLVRHSYLFGSEAPEDTGLRDV